MFDFNKLDHYKDCIETAKACRLSWVEECGIISFQMFKNDYMLRVEDARIHDSDWEEFKKEVANYFLSSY